jgi:tetraacyldisaccharide 4'-kinase
VLVNYNNPVDNDELIPIGTLRDLPSRIHRANTIIITGLPFRSDVDEDTDSGDLSGYIKKQESSWRKRLRLLEDQNIYFSVILYKNLLPIFTDIADTRYIYSKTAILFSGIANDKVMKNYISRSYNIKESIQFQDHRDFSLRDVKLINKMAANNPISVIITTEKDSKRIIEAKGISDEIKRRLFYLPIEVAIIPEERQADFVKKIIPTEPASA